MVAKKYIEWFNASEMHEHSKEWFSELSFIKDVQQFLNNLITSFAIKPLDKMAFEQLADFKKSIAFSQNQLIPIFKKVQKHMNQLDILTDDVNQLEMEKAYRKTHKVLFTKVSNFLIEFKAIKQDGFSKLTCLLKERKKLFLGNPKYKLRT